MNNILIIADGYPSPGLPYSAFIANIAREMTRQGMTVSVIAPQSLTKHWLRHVPLAPRHFMEEIEGRTIQIYRPYSITTGDGKLGFITRWCNRLVTTLVARRLTTPNMVYAHFWLNAAMAIPFVSRAHLPFIVATGEDIIPIGQIKDKEKSWFKEHVQHVVCVSTKNKQESIAYGLAKDEKCVVLPNAYNPQEFYYEDGCAMREQLGIAKDDFVIAFCGRFNNRKGVFRVDDALKQLNGPHIKAIYVGSPMDNCKDEPNYKYIAFKGQLPHSEIVHYLNAADVFVLPSMAEGCPNSVIEAMACGLPIISSDLPFNYDILDDTNSLLVDPTNVDAIANAILQLKNDKDLCARLSQGALLKAQSLRIEERTKHILQIIEQ